MSEGRLIPCTVCGFPWRVIEIPVGNADWTIDPDLYVCPNDRRPAKGQLEMQAHELVDEIPYDTAMVQDPVLMRVAGIDISTFNVDVVTVPLDGPGQPVWHRFPLTGTDAFDRARSVAEAVPGRSSVLWDDIVAVGIEHPAGHHGTGPILRVQGAILGRIPARMLVEPWSPAKWRKAVGLPGNASKTHVWEHAWDLQGYPANKWMATTDGYVPYDATDAYSIALATCQAITTEQAA